MCHTFRSIKHCWGKNIYHNYTTSKSEYSNKQHKTTTKHNKHYKTRFELQLRYLILQLTFFFSFLCENILSRWIKERWFLPPQERKLKKRRIFSLSPGLSVATEVNDTEREIYREASRQTAELRAPRRMNYPWEGLPWSVKKGKRASELVSWDISHACVCYDAEMTICFPTHAPLLFIYPARPNPEDY